MSGRPAFMDLRPKSSDHIEPSAPSPRLALYDGEVPPTLSPLDAFALQSRLLAEQLDSTKRNGRRASRLPPIAVSNSLAQPRPGYFKSPTGSSYGNLPPIASRSNSKEEKKSPKGTPELEFPTFRPQSEYTRFSGIPLEDVPQNEPVPAPPQEDKETHEADDVFSTPAPPKEPVPPASYFSIPRVQSPEPVAESSRGNAEYPNPLDAFQNRGKRPPEPQRGPSTESASSSGHSVRRLPRNRDNDPQRGPSTESASSQGYSARSLAPPTSPRGHKAPSLRSVHDSDDDYASSNGGSTFTYPRKLSSSSCMSMPRSPLSPFIPPHQRSHSPSVSSELSASGHLRRPTFNFSRPLSNRPSMDMPSSSRQPSDDGQISPVSSNNNFPTPASFSSEDYNSSTSEITPAASSYIYSKYSLPRGRVLSRESMILQDLELPHFQWDQPFSNVAPVDNSSHTPRTTSPSSSAPRPSTGDSPGRQSEPSVTNPAISSTPEKIRPPPTPITDQQLLKSSASMNSDSTVKAPSTRTVTTVTDLSAEEHLQKGIDCHEAGSVKESTYHLRLAAKMNNPTAMLLYALACRHGWGMKANQQEGVHWLRKAADYASLEIAENEDAAQDNKPANINERKTRRAQFALSIYELGVSHLNGWGTEQDKALALRCFEIAGNWGDGDALAEAGFCYTQGIGCKKDLKKAAKFYRMAEAKGISMVGNSWIYKPKYMDDEDERNPRSAHQTSDKKPRSRSRARTLFSRRRADVD
ncbi:MAG: hypothetical protein M1834_002322 [Cirrosporium novae-zelandiae]|nr:MAG: hypothetical protein M1834_002322 [Cirrosporium novae-zelandiae]